MPKKRTQNPQQPATTIATAIEPPASACSDDLIDAMMTDPKSNFIVGQLSARMGAEQEIKEAVAGKRKAEAEREVLERLVARTLAAGVKQEKADEGSKPKDNETAGEVLCGEEKAIGLKVKHPEWSHNQIAKAVPCGRRTLFTWLRYMAACQALKADRSSLPRGQKDGQTGDLEAWDE